MATEKLAVVQPLTIRNVQIGAGRPKIIVPITERVESAAIQTAAELASNKQIDLVEYRIDFLTNALDGAVVAQSCRQLSDALRGKPPIVTFRTKSEGGETEVSDAAYVDIYRQILKAKAADLIDIELNRGPAVSKELVAAAKGAKTFAIISNHDFEGTPPEAELLARLVQMSQLGADILKIAAMPRDPGDVLTLLKATWEMRKATTRPMITMSMAGLGGLSRLAGEVFGSAATFGRVGRSSAPGQMNLPELSSALELIHQSLAGG